MWSEEAVCVLAVASVALAVMMILGERWCPLGCLTRRPKAYDEDFELMTQECDPLLPQLSPIVYYYSGTTPDFQATLRALARARTSVEVNDALPGPALEWMFTTLSEAQQFVALCQGHIDFSAIMVSNLASLVVGLQKYGSHEPIAQFITDCFRAKVAGDLLRLKHEIEKRVPVYDVVYRRIQSRVLQECILAHMELQARVLKISEGFEPPIKLISEIDDTLFAARHDSLYPDLTVYPGVQQFSREVLGSNSRRRLEGRASLDTRDQRQVFFTKRTEMWRQRADDELVSSGFDHYTLITGTVNEMIGGAEVSFQHKLQGIRQYKRIYGECELVFIGNNGDSGVALGQELLRHPQLYSVSAVLLHDVLRQHPPVDNSTTLRVFRTYVGAAFQLCQLELLSLNASVRVARAASAAFRAIPFPTTDTEDEAALDLASELADLLDALSHRDANAIATLLPRSVFRFLADRLPPEERHLIV